MFGSIGGDGSDIRSRSDKLFQYILEPIGKAQKLELIRVDKSNDSGSINQEIIDNIKNADLVIADITDHNPNVFYELGYRHALQKPLILIKSKNVSIPFDIANIRVFEYGFEVDDAETFKDRLSKTIETFDLEMPVSTAKHEGEPISGINTTILQELYKIQDLINDLKINSATPDTTTISLLADKIAQAGNESMEVAMMETFAKNPDSFSQLMEMFSKIPK